MRYEVKSQVGLPPILNEILGGLREVADEGYGEEEEKEDGDV